jgi:hypothetical protein
MLGKTLFALVIFSGLSAAAARVASAPPYFFSLPSKCISFAFAP